ncbi:hypothetical protein [Paludisphaera borealis]|uniref:Uncharacterized protein n=1 Tax=Paludisphaera borealis TaxID=1387353 RepID=A0A1U7CRG3_9BACT|nr:hypothetical protein [Paludisphaera borealis]APW61522.1 hypothetical protein BSF38_03038 [Paludisphaera borealis]
MHRKRYAFRPDASLLESKLLLSLTATPGVGVGNPAEVSTLLAAKGQHQQTNTLQGRYSAGQDMRAADAPLDVKLTGTGQVKDLGRTQLSGSLQLGGFRMPGNDVTGTVKLSNARGTVTLQLNGLGGNGQVPGATLNLSASVVSGTGAYKNFRRIGTATVIFGPDTVQAKSTGANSAIGGTLTIKLNLNPPVR